MAHSAIGGYDMSSNITIKNGTIDGGDTGKATESSDLVRIDHASGVTVSGVAFKNVYDCHHLEFVGVKDGTVTNCTFSGFRYQKGHEKDTEYGREAIELDGAWKGSDGELWAKDTKLDMTSNQNCTISGCVFTDVPSALGSHHWSTSAGYKNSSNVVLENNRITAASKYKYFKTAITCGGIDNLVVRNNYVDGPYVFTVHAYRGTGISILNNEIDNSSDNAVMVNQDARNVVVEGNTIKGVSGSDGHGVSVADAAVTSISNNAISNVKHNGINIVSGTYGAIDGNTVSNPAEHGISVVNKKSAGLSIASISNNTVNSAGHNGINLAAGSGGVVSAVDSNTVNSPSEHGVSVLSGTVSSISGNVVNDAAKNGVNVKDGAVSEISGNTVGKSKGHGVSVVGGTVKNISGNAVKVSGKKGSGVCVTAGKVTAISGNTIKAGKNGISVVGGKVGKKGKKTTGILDNTIKKAKKGHGITVSGKGMAANIAGNTITKPKGNGVSINGKAKVYRVNKNTIKVKKGKIGIYVGSTAVDKVKVKKNKITVSKKNRAVYKAWDVTTKESGNKVKIKKL